MHRDRMEARGQKRAGNARIRPGTPRRAAAVEIDEFVVTSLGELLEGVTPRQPEQTSGRRRSYSIYRGTNHPDPRLLTSLDRLGGSEPPHAKAHLEEHILRNFVRYAHPLLAQSYQNDWELLVLAQHHGLPTRLLDWSYSPLVAAHFATVSEEAGADRVIWKLDWKQVHQHFGFKPLAFLVSDLDEALHANGYGSPWDLFSRGAGGQGTFICMLEPPVLDARMKAQSAAFTLCSAKDRSFDRVLADCGLTPCLTRFVIPESKVGFVRDQLDMCGIDERNLFPDLDGIASELKRYYGA